MKVENLFKHRGDSMNKYSSELMQWVSPSVREYWGDLLHKTNSRQLFSWVRDFHQPAVNEDAPIAEPLILKPEAQRLYKQLQTQIGEVIHTGKWLVVDQERINQFGQVTEDMQWIHTDPQKAEVDSPFRTTIAHGFLTLALLPKLTDSVDPDKPIFPTAKMVVNIGLNEVRFPYPVKSGNRVRAISTLLKVTPIKKGLEIEREIKVEIEGIRRPGCVVVSVIQLHF
ncbi:MaoC family dehydratase [Vibrio anguillarum]|uniref:MaoC family dehydratase n=1 Tax=Vibrio anguillarum TaxID=55601 RepID=UPI00097E2D49|nr:MaoC family dehydratase [Vibrio anguillarum]ASG01507.1 dehydratase [Vibrio anguillarum]AXN05846.1 MaoC family dehydratase [Vibrio anguillarum]MBT2913922.1 MaoC family dehydratase [Vibrio anguillarum]MBT2946400.1 MaoC family dehydratase [Vibrio anguillarum]OQQ09447.1 dehydratase [Vibrio anguillarum]